MTHSDIQFLVNDLVKLVGYEGEIIALSRRDYAGTLNMATAHNKYDIDKRYLMFDPLEIALEILPDEVRKAQILHELGHLKLQHLERDNAGEITRAQAEDEADNFAVEHGYGASLIRYLEISWERATPEEKVYLTSPCDPMGHRPIFERISYIRSQMCEHTASHAGELFEQLAYEKTGFKEKKSETVAVGAAS